MQHDPMEPLKILAVEPWLGGSHAAFLESWSARSTHRVDVVGLADRHWKWRMRAGAWELARKLGEREPPDVVLVSDYLDLPGFLGFLGPAWSRVPFVLYLHENQLTYPLQAGEAEAQRDTSYGFTNILSCVRADALVFNTRFHLDDFTQASTEFLRRLPKPTPAAELRRRLAAARVVAPGVELDSIPLGTGGAESDPLRILFHHRWQFDKDPLAFLRAMRALGETGCDFELVLLGEDFTTLPLGTEEALAELSPRIAHRGFAATRAQYAAWLGSCDLCVSTARHEFFGIGTVEAMGAGVTPLLPARLSYPELVGVDPGPPVLYNDDHELLEKLVAHARAPADLRRQPQREALRAAALRWSPAHSARELDALCLELAGRRGLNRR